MDSNFCWNIFWISYRAKARSLPRLSERLPCWRSFNIQILFAWKMSWCRWKSMVRNDINVTYPCRRPSCIWSLNIWRWTWRSTLTHIAKPGLIQCWSSLGPTSSCRLFTLSLNLKFECIYCSIGFTLLPPASHPSQVWKLQISWIACKCFLFNTGI